MAQPNEKNHLFATAWRQFVILKGDPDIVTGVLPEPEPEFSFCPFRKFSSDFAFPTHQLLIEVDGGQWVAKGGKHNQDRDRDKTNVAAALGWRVMRFSTQQLERDPRRCVLQVLTALGVNNGVEHMRVEKVVRKPRRKKKAR